MSEEASTPQEPMELLQGTLDMMILRALAQGPTHGYGIMRWIRAASGEALRIEEGALYPALHRLEERGWVGSEWGLSENNRRAKFYALTRRGKRHLRAETASWSRYVEAVGRILQGA